MPRGHGDNIILYMLKIVFSIMLLVGCTAYLSGCSSLSQATPARAAFIGGVSGYYGWTTLGRVSSESQAAELASSKGFSNYMYDSVTGIAYGK